MADTKSWIALGIRQGRSDWQKNLPAWAAWAVQNGLDAVDLSDGSASNLAALKQAGLRVGTVDLIQFPNLMAEDAGERKALIERNVAFVGEAAGMGVKTFFTCLLPGDPAGRRKDNYKLAVESFQPIAAAAARAGASLAIEGYPGSGPHHGAIGCTPESVRALIKDVGPGFGLNYDPSHLVRLGVDHVRFLNEFFPYVRHVHGKDTDIDAQRQYEFGTQQSATFAADPAFGGPFWRYTLPGHGQVRWVEVFRILHSVHYDGACCIELEDARFNGTEAGEKAGLLLAIAYLRGVAGSAL